MNPRLVMFVFCEDGVVRIYGLGPGACMAEGLCVSVDAVASALEVSETKREKL